jgi:outer membrane protein assembly factor BamB
VSRINPFADFNASRYTAGPVSVDAAGNLYYNAIELQAGAKSLYANDAVDSWLVKVTPGDVTSKVSYFALVPDAPGAAARCETSFPTAQLPWPPSPTAVPSTVACGSVRAALNVAPAIAPDGTIYSVARAHTAAANRYAWLVAVNADLTPKWDASLRNRFHDGCGVPVEHGGVLPPNGAPGGCRAGASYGVDPAVNHAGDGRVLDNSSSSPVVAPDGTVFYGAWSRYNYSQGHLMHFAADGAYLGAYRYGFDQTPAIRAHGATYSVVVKDNQYGGIGSYCAVEAFCPADRTASNPEYPEGFFITQLNHNLHVEWRLPSQTATGEHPHGFEWCVNAFVIDRNGIVYANSEDGHLYAINPDGTVRQSIFQRLALGAAYTPTSIGGDGKIYSQNAGHLFVVGE